MAEALEVWVIIKGIGRPSLDPLEIGKRGDLASLQSSTRDLSVKEDQLSKVPAHNKQTTKHENTLFPQMAGSSEAHVILICEAGSLRPYEKYLAEFGWTLCLNNAGNLLLPSWTWGRRQDPTDCRPQGR